MIDKGGFKLITIPSLGDSRGELVVLERKGIVPFEVKRLYYIFNTQEGISRGFHAHKQLKQFAICLKGECKMIMDDGQTRKTILLDNPTKGLLISNNVWHEMHDFSSDCVLLVLASDYYDEADYIRDYSEFRKVV